MDHEYTEARLWKGGGQEKPEQRPCKGAPLRYTQLPHLPIPIQTLRVLSPAVPHFRTATILYATVSEEAELQEGHHTPAALSSVPPSQGATVYTT